MKITIRLLFIVLVISALAMLAGSANCATIFKDGFEPGMNSANWVKGPLSWAGAQNQEELQGDTSHIRTPGINSAREHINYRVTYNSQKIFSTAYNGGVYLKVWMFEDNDLAFPGYNAEATANGFITMLDSATAMDYFQVGVMAQWGRNLPSPTRAWFNNCSIETATDQAVVLDGTMGKSLVPRRQGWRKYSILLNNYTGTAGDAQFYIDDKLVYNGKRAAAPPSGAAPVDTIILGSKWWTNENYWFDDVDFGTIETPVNCTTIADAMAQPDGTWVDLTPKVVTGCFTKAPFPGNFAIEEDDRSGGLWVATSYVANVAPATPEAEKVSIKGIMYTNEAGQRYLDAIKVTSAQTLATQPKIIGTSIKGLKSDKINGMLTKVWGKVTAIDKERSGDWRRFIMISDGSDTQLKCYWDLISTTTNPPNPVPNVNIGDYVSVVGVPNTDVLVNGGASEKSLWIRKAGDLVIIKAAP